MKRISFILITVLLCFCIINILITGCSTVSENKFYIKSYKDIPGITDEEISTVEALRESFSSLIYGVSMTNEAFVYDDGSLGGFASLLCKRLSELFDIPFTPVTYEWDELVRRFDSSDIQFTGEFTRTEERLNNYAMTDAIIQRDIKIFTVKDALPLTEIARLRPIICAFLEGSNTYNLVKEKWQLPFEPVFISDEIEIMEQMYNGTVDAYIEENVEEAILDEISHNLYAGERFIEADLFYPLTYSPVSLSTADKRLSAFISVIDKYLKNGGDRELVGLYNKGLDDYLRFAFKRALTAEEFDYISSHNTAKTAVKVAAEADNYPASFYNRHEGVFQGIAPDILVEISELTGLYFEFGGNMDDEWSELLAGLERGDFDMVTELLYADSRVGRFLWSSEPYSEDRYALLSRSDAPYWDINQVLYARVGLLEGAAYTDLFNEWFPSGVEKIMYGSTEEVFAALERGDIDLFMSPQNLLLHMTHYMERPNFIPNVVFDHAAESYFGFNRDEEILCSIISKAQVYVDINRLTERWKSRVFDVRSKTLSDMLPYIAVLVLLLIAGLVFAWYMLRKNQNLTKNLENLVDERTAELKITLDDLSRARDEAVANSKSKSEFLAKMSHEIRTPLNAIAGMAELSLRESTTPKAKEYSIGIKQASANLLSIINDILDFSKIESGKMDISNQPYELASLLNDVISIIRIRVIDRPVLFVVNIDSYLPALLIGDEIRIRQILLNLLSNAVKYTKEGYIALAISGNLTDDHTAILNFEISDTGIGISEEELPRLFGEFSQLNITHNRGIEGTGLGLAITRNLCLIMGGDISVSSVYGEGSTFTVTLPQKYEEYKKFASVEDKSKQVLLYEPRDIYANSIVCAIDNLDIRCTLVTNQNELQHALENDSYSFLFFSSFLYEGVKETLERMKISVNLVALSEYGEVITYEGYRNIAMPVHSISIANVLNNVSDDALYHDGEKSGVRFIAPTARILLVDDINTNLKVAEGLMSPYGMQIDTCESGRQAIELVKSHEYDIVFMDHMMPEMDGIEATRAIRALDIPCADTLPIIALTANAVSGVREMFIQNGFSDFLSKPIEIKRLSEILDRWIKKEKREHAEVVEQPVSCFSFELKGVNTSLGVEMVGGDTDKYIKILEIFLLDGRTKTEELNLCLRERDLSLYTTYVHALKSVLASIGARELSERAKSLEQAGKNENLSYIDDNHKEFIAGLTALLDEIEGVTGNKNRHVVTGLMSETERKRELIILRDALDNYDAAAVDRAFEILKAGCGEGDNDMLIKIQQHITKYDYDEALHLVDELLK